VKININQISPEGLTLTEDLSAAALDLETDIVKFRGPIRIKAGITRITNAISVRLGLRAAMHVICSRCLQDCEIDFKKDTAFNYQADKDRPVIDLDPDIREELLLDYPMKPLCRPDCKGLCPKCGKNLNEGGCSCGPT
jgi:uncharacterized protein